MTSWVSAFSRRGDGLISGLDGLRAISILGVIYGHLLWAPSFDARWLIRVLNPAGPGVRLFFVISGFLITTILLKERAKTGTISLRQFYARRALRIFPAYYAFLACVFLLALTGFIELERSDYFYALTYTFNMKGEQSTWWLGHTWSLAVEEQFYLLWPLVVWRSRGRLAVGVAIAAAIAAPLLRGTLMSTLAPPAYGRWSMALPLVADPLAMGALLAFVFRHEEFRTRLRAWLSGPFWLLIPVVVLACEGLDHRPNLFPHPVIYTSVLQPMATLCLTMLVARFALITNDRAAWLMNARALTAVGVASYSLYLWQMLFISPYDAPLTRFPFSLLWLAIVAGMSFLFVEQPFNRLRGRTGTAAAALVPSLTSVN